MRALALSALLFLSFSAQAAPRVTVQKGDTLYSIARKHGLSVEQLRAINGLKSDTVKIGQVLQVQAAAPLPARAPAKAPASRTAPPPPSRVGAAQTSTYTVKPGDNLGKIAAAHHTTVAHLQALNGLEGHMIRVGQVLKLTGAAPAPARRAPAAIPATPHASQAAKSASRSAQTYTVKSGDTLGKIAGRYGVSVGALQQANRLSSTTIRLGQTLKIPPRGTRAPAAPAVPAGMEARTVYSYERVKLGDTPARFAARYGLSAEQVRQLNGLGSVRQIIAGTKLLVPRRVTVPMPPAAVRPALTHRRVVVAGAKVDIVQVDLRHKNVLVAPILPTRSLSFGSGATVRSLTRSSGAAAVINGSYFHPRTYAPAGDIVMQGRLLTWGRIPAALAITPDNRASIRGSTTAIFGRGLDSSWEGMETVIASGPKILAGGAVMNSFSDVFRDPAVFGEAARSAIGLQGSRDLMFVSTHAKLSVTQMARVMQLLGARDALLLDGGSSAGLSYGGNVLLDSIRKVSYGIGVFNGYQGKRYMR